MPHFRLPRRTFLRGAGGIAVALPALEIMSLRTARAQAVPKRFLMAAGGGSVPDETTGLRYLVPAATCRVYEPRRALGPIQGGLQWQVGGSPYDSMKADVGLVSGLKVPWSTDPDHNSTDLARIPDGGRALIFHGSSQAPQF